MFVDVIIPLAVDGLFTYSVPEERREAVGEGCLVVVPFAGNRRYTGVVRAVRERAPEGVTPRPIDRVIEEGFSLSAIQLRFLLWMSDYYMALPGEVTRAALPVAMRLESRTCFMPADPPSGTLDEEEERVLRVLRPGEYLSVAEIEKLLGRGGIIPLLKNMLDASLVTVKEQVDHLFKPRHERLVRWSRPFSEEELHAWLDKLRSPHHEILCRWIEHVTDTGARAARLEEFRRVTGASPSNLKTLRDKGLFEIITEEVSRLDEDDETPCPLNPLSAGQERALEEIRAAFGQREVVLLHGVTSSGKTEIYTHLIRETLDRGEQVLYLLPEIALTVQIVKRLRRFFGRAVGIYHSGMADGARVETWRRQNGADPFPVILGVRSSLFLPYRRLGLVIVDEEHETSYKQSSPNPRYHGRDAAIMLAHLHGARVLLGSATPSFESYHHAVSGKYGLVRLTARHGEVLMPRVILADVATYRQKRLMDGIFTPPLREEARKVLEAGEQVILFQNRRGYSTYLQCNRCGHIPRCTRCDVNMTYYKSRQRLSCHYCGSARPYPVACEACGEGHYAERTPGTERVEEEVARLFPAARVARLDLEVMNRKSKLQGVIDRFESGELDVLVGTQMVSKGLDFERVKLVGVIDADTLTAFPDFRVEERAYQLLTQVSGRSGRKGRQGVVVIQASNIANRVYEWVIRGEFPDFYDAFAGERETFHYPPFCRLVRIELRHAREEPLRLAANALATVLRGELGQRARGPAQPEIPRVQGEHRLHILVKSGGNPPLPALKVFLRESARDLLSRPEFKSVKVYFDVDPL
ncbi:MAG: primosomal protein N' [Odoribacteraceae bacterium]|jgi:primosomal protein N' (replication factor Y)|nr:primosomal protein N' [Odoribacteraceae bacterium]